MAIQAYQADLHIHTLLSPCAEVEMIPSLIVAAAQMAGLDVIAVADHNSCENAGAVIVAAEGSGLRVLPGLEVQSVEGVHLLCLFDDPDRALAMQDAVYSALPSPSPCGREPGRGCDGEDTDPPAWLKAFGQQMVVDGGDEFVRYCERLLSLPTAMDVDEVFERATALGGMVIPSHIDRSGTGICGVLGMLPETPLFEAVEISTNLTADDARSRYPSVGDRPVFRSSDAHWLSAIGEQRTTLYLEHRTVAEIGLACRGEAGRRVGDA